jgi:hypothetical protein
MLNMVLFQTTVLVSAVLYIRAVLSERLVETYVYLLFIYSLIIIFSTH